MYAAIAAETPAMTDASAPEAWRAAAMNILYAGAQVYTFNFFPSNADPTFALLSEVGARSTLDELDRTYGLDNLATDPQRAARHSMLDAHGAARVVRGNPYGAPDLRLSSNIVGCEGI